ncbi:BPG-independent [Mycena epipterygia]|nr:BPG-independent [Mycena epipterygia]
MSRLWLDLNFRSLYFFAAHGTAVGLSDGLMGNSEVGHLNIGAGHVKKMFHKNETILASLKRAKDGDGCLHLMGLKEEYGELATVVGRYYAMDRDKRRERAKIAVDRLVGGEGVVDEIKANSEKDVTDEILKPIIVNVDAGRIKDGDTLFFFNYRSDRMRELVTVLGLPEKPMEVTVPKDLHITTMSRYNTEFPFSVAFPPQAMTNVLAEWLAGQGVKQAHVAATEKYAHVTFFFDGGVKKQFERFMIPSPKVATYDLQPEMSVQAVADKVASIVKSKGYDFVIAPPDMVRLASTYPAVSAITHTDPAVGTVYDACQAAGCVLALFSVLFHL